MRAKSSWLVAGLGVLAAGILSLTRAPAPPTPPNIIVIKADDHAEKAISAYGSTLIRTPNIDRLADEGIRFSSSFVTNSICAPSRAVLLTGKYSHRNWMPSSQHLDLFADDELPLPPTFGDDYKGRLAAQEADMRIKDMYLSLDMKLHEQSYERETGTGGNPEFDPEPAWRASYARITEQEKAAWDARYEPINQAFADSPPEGAELTEWKYQRYIKDYLRCVASIDDNLGRLLDRLDEQGLSGNTIVIYTSDQGFYLGELLEQLRTLQREFGDEVS